MPSNPAAPGKGAIARWFQKGTSGAPCLSSIVDMRLFLITRGGFDAGLQLNVYPGRRHRPCCEVAPATRNARGGPPDLS